MVLFELCGIVIALIDYQEYEESKEKQIFPIKEVKMEIVKIKERHETSKKVNERYANFLKIGHNAYEFVMDFGQMYRENESESEEYHTRIITSPVHVKAFIFSLLESIGRYEQEYGSAEKQIWH